MSAEFDQVVAEFQRFEASIRNVDDRFAGLGAMQRELTELRASAASPDGGVTVTTGPGGAVLDVKFTAAALAKGPQALSTALMATLREAVGAAARRQAVIVEEHMGDDEGLVERVLETQAEAFGTSVEELRSKLAEETTSQEAPAASEDFPEVRVLRQADAPPPPAPPARGGSAGDSFLRSLYDEED
ncbi:YbaB/EbfC family nucleoid-associated protein [Amycolatopsis sp., V23-08]|uniref:YbaB/EbfC family nucleoid-associated protein n=1 Tax=Amycolatopsis heterodermiae TaxID=3110235 RepID=A0ABU5R714_9PSEU|nr:YbaB/EbfC family nucleoid-associated protein [Amycolatopsis sp., V23-08]MEA5362027.1 YbaB/EbfC family nucleoid-associated protein [Amycolatopsis sp., V23-08]